MSLYFMFIFQKLFAVIGPPLREGRNLTGTVGNHAPPQNQQLYTPGFLNLGHMFHMFLGVND